MLQPENNVQSLLYDHDCVIIPQFGGFIKRENPTVIDKFSNTIKPKGKSVFFNGALQQNDGLLANHIAEKKAIGYQEALDLLNEWVVNTEKEISLTGKFKFGNLGTFFVNAEGKKWFAPNPRLNFSKTTFGLEALVVKAIINTVEENKEKEEVAKAKYEKETVQALTYKKAERKQKKSSFTMKIAASFILLAGAGTALYFSFFSGKPAHNAFEQAEMIPFKDTAPLPVQEEIIEETENTEDTIVYEIIAEEEQEVFAVPEETAWEEQAEIKEKRIVQNSVQHTLNDVDEKNGAEGIYTILAGAFLHESNAQRRLEFLTQNGFDVSPVKPEYSRLTRIQCGKFNSREEAETELKKVKEIIPEAHITSFK